MEQKTTGGNNEPASLADKTLSYWNASSAYHDRPSRISNLNTEKAIKLCGDNLMVLNPARPLAVRFAFMREAIIMGSPRKRKSEQTAATVLKLARK